MERSLILMRIIFTDKSTIGDLYWDSGEFECNILEDTCRKRAGEDNILQEKEKLFGETAIPSGRYEIKMQRSNRYQREMPYLLDVPYFKGVMIHWGNYPKDTNGCLLVGEKNPSAPDFVSASQKAYNHLEPKITEILSSGKLFINIHGGYSA